MLRRREDRHRRAAAHLDRALRALCVGTGAVAPAWRRVRSDGGNSRLPGGRGSEPRRLGDRAGPRRGRADSPPRARPAKPAQDYAGAGRLPGLRARIDGWVVTQKDWRADGSSPSHTMPSSGSCCRTRARRPWPPAASSSRGQRRGRGSSGSSSATWLRAQRGWQPRRAAASGGAAITSVPSRRPIAASIRPLSSSVRARPLVYLDARWMRVGHGGRSRRGSPHTYRSTAGRASARSTRPPDLHRAWVACVDGTAGLDRLGTRTVRVPARALDAGIAGVGHIGRILP